MSASQREKLLTRLRQSDWVALPEIVEGMGIYRVSARIWELRKQGFVIESKEQVHGKKRFRWYRLVEKGQQNLFPGEAA